MYIIIYNTKSGGCRKGRKEFVSVFEANKYIHVRRINNWKMIAKNYVGVYSP